MSRDFLNAINETERLRNDIELFRIKHGIRPDGYGFCHTTGLNRPIFDKPKTLTELIIEQDIKKRMKTIKIEIPDGFEVDSFDPKNLELILKVKKTVFDRIKTFEDVLVDNGLCRNYIFEGPKDEIAYRKLKLIAKSLNKGEKSDPQSRYHPTFRFDSPHVGFSCCGYMVSVSMGIHIGLNTAQLATYAGSQFPDIYRDFLVKPCEV